jgi:hypothetical protein
MMKVKEAIDRLTELLNERGVGDEFVRTLMTQAARADLDPREYLDVAIEVIKSTRHPREIGAKRWRMEIMTGLKIFREMGERPGKKSRMADRELRNDDWKKKLTEEPCSKCGGTGWEIVQGKGARKCLCRSDHQDAKDAKI